MITSATSSTQIYSINQVTKVSVTTAYTEVTPTSSISRMEQMQEKYKDVYSPMPASYSKEIEELQSEKIREVYPNAMSIQETIQWIQDNLKPIKLGEEESVEDKIIRETKNNEYVESMGGKEAYKERLDFIYETRAQYPINRWASENFSPSNTKELTTFYNAAVYEGLEKGKDLNTATREAYNPIYSYMDTSESVNNELEKVLSSPVDILNLFQMDLQETETASSRVDRTDKYVYKHGIGLGDTVDLRSYGFNMEWNHFDSVQNDNAMVSMLEKRVEMYDFMLENPSVIESAFLKLDGASQGGRRTSECAILEPIRRYHLPNAELALSVFEKYKIFDSVDIKI